MAQPPLQDLINDVDYTALSSVDGAQLNAGFSGLQGNSNALAGGGQIGFVITTIDSALNTPIVPDPTQVGYSKWVGYPWLRIPYNGATDTSGTLYTWNNNVPSDPTYLKWVTTKVNVSTILSDITAIQTDVTDAVNTANTAALTANTANANATTASNAASAASASAAAANALATTANNTANTANATANAVAATAANAVAIATNANATANTALNTVNATFTNSGNVLANGYQKLVFAHGLARTPSYVDAFLVCAIAEQGYNVGDQIKISSVVRSYVGSGIPVAAFSLVANAADITLIQESTAVAGNIDVMNQNNGTYAIITNANWTLTLVARL